MRVLLIYYTGTYNTRYLTNLLKLELSKQDNEIDVVEVKGDTPICQTDNYDLIGIGYPIYAFNSPRLLNRYLKKIAFKKQQKFFIYKQSGETYKVNNASSRTIKKIIRKRKGILKVEHHFLLPYDIHFRFPDSLVKQELLYDNKLLKVLIYELNNNVDYQIKSNLIYDINSWLFSIQKIGGFINGPLYKVDRKKCIDCNICITTCPVKNIYKDKNNLIKFKRRCEMCMRCSMYCPKDAISIGILNGWKVNGPYQFDRILADQTNSGDFIKGNEKGFYKCFHRSFKEIDDLYNATFKQE